MSKETKKHDEVKSRLDTARLSAAPEMLRELSLSMASFIAEIDANSVDVAAYIEQRFQPLIPLIRSDERVRAAIDCIGRDGRKLVR